MSIAFQQNAFQNDAFQITITPNNNGLTGGDDAYWSKEDRKRYRALQKKLRLAEEKRREALKADQAARKRIITDLVSPKPKKKAQERALLVEETGLKLSDIDRYISNLEKQHQDLLDAILIRAAKLRLEQELAVLEAKRQAEQEDEEALLALIL